MTTTVRLGTYNLLHGGGERWRAQAEFLRAQNLDVLCLQEAKKWDEGGYARMLGFAELLGLQAQFAPSNSHNCHLLTLYRAPSTIRGATSSSAPVWPSPSTT